MGNNHIYTERKLQRRLPTIHKMTDTAELQVGQPSPLEGRARMVKRLQPLPERQIIHTALGTILDLQTRKNPFTPLEQEPDNFSKGAKEQLAGKLYKECRAASRFRMREVKPARQYASQQLIRRSKALSFGAGTNALNRNFLREGVQRAPSAADYARFYRDKVVNKGGETSR